METKEQKNETRTKEKKPLTEQQRQQRKKMLVYPLMVLLFVGCMWLIFAPSSEDKEKAEQGQGFNTDMPLPEDSKIIGDKAKAYEQQDLENKQKERRGMVGDLSAFWNDGKEDAPTDDATVSDDYRLTTETPEKETEDETQASIRTSAAAYQRLNTSLGTFYEPPKEDTEKEELPERIDELESMLMAHEGKPSTMEEQMALLEKSYELAAKYQNGGNNAGQATQAEGAGSPVSIGEKTMKAEPVSDVRRTVVSSLPQPMTDSAFIADYSGERNYGFHTVIGGEATSGKNTIAACVQGDQTLTDGQTVKLRLLEPMRVSGRIIPRNTTLVGAARLQGERLGINITSLEHQGTIIPVELEVYDSDGQAGIFIPGSMEIDAVKEIGANMGSSLGSSINISTDAGAQLASDLGRGAIQGISQYISKRMRTVKVHLKSGYKVLLYQNKE